MGGGKTEAPDVMGAAREEGYQARKNALAELIANRPDQINHKGSTTWERVAINPATGQPYTGPQERTYWDHDNHRWAGGYIDPADLHYEWTQTTKLNDQYQALHDNEAASMEDAQYYRNAQLKDWYNNPASYQTNLPGNTINRSDLDQFGTTNPITGSEDWREFGTSDPTLGADDWRQFGTTESTIGADDWRQFGDTQRTINSGDWDARWGSSQDHGYGDHDMGGGDWSLIDYSPAHIRAQAEQQTLDFMNSQLDPQWDTKRQELEIKLANQGLQWGDAAYDNAMAAFERSKSSAYAGARNQALADSRAEAMMLWDQEMGRSEQKNRYTQADLDNEYRARQANISNYLSGRQQDQQGYLAYQQAAFDQDRLARQQQLDANLGYGREAYQQDYQTRQQQLESDLAYGRENWQQDYQSRQQQIDANRLYDQQAFEQDLAARQAAISNYLQYGNAEFGQGMSREQMALEQKQAEEWAQQQRYGLINPADHAANMEAIAS